MGGAGGTKLLSILSGAVKRADIGNETTESVCLLVFLQAPVRDVFFLAPVSVVCMTEPTCLFHGYHLSFFVGVVGLSLLWVFLLFFNTTFVVCCVQCSVLRFFCFAVNAR